MPLDVPPATRGRQWRGEVAIYIDGRGELQAVAGAGMVNPGWQLLERRPVVYERGFGLQDVGPDA